MFISKRNTYKSHKAGNAGDNKNDRIAKLEAELAALKAEKDESKPKAKVAEPKPKAKAKAAGSKLNDMQEAALECAKYLKNEGYFDFAKFARISKRGEFYLASSEGGRLKMRNRKVVKGSKGGWVSTSTDLPIDWSDAIWAKLQ